MTAATVVTAGGTWDVHLWDVRVVVWWQEMLATMDEDLDEDLKHWLASKHFQKDCERRFRDADEDGSNSLEAEELVPIIRGMLPEALQDALTLQHTERFLAIFDEDGDGEVGQDEFSGFCRFVVLVAHMAKETKVSQGDLKKDDHDPIEAVTKAQENMVLKIEEMSLQQRELWKHYEQVRYNVIHLSSIIYHPSPIDQHSSNPAV